VPGSAIREEVVGLVDAPCLRVVHRDEAEGDEPHLDRLEDAANGGERTVLSVREKSPGALFRVRSGLALVRDDGVHGRTLEAAGVNSMRS
jgi:hypothetical protein